MLSREAKREFLSICQQLRFENLGTGELPHDEMKRRFEALMAKWRALEQHVGRRVFESEVWGWLKESK